MPNSQAQPEGLELSDVYALTIIEDAGLELVMKLEIPWFDRYLKGKK